MEYIIEDEFEIELDIVTKPKPTADVELELPVISLSNPPTVTPLQVLDYGVTSIEVSFTTTTERAEEVVKGVLCGTTNPPTFENADYRLLHGQGSMDLAFAGLQSNTEYYLRPYALSDFGYKYGDIVVQRTKSNPIPGEYQLVEWLSNNGGTGQQLRLYNIFDTDSFGFFRKYDFFVRNVDGYSYGFFFGTFGNTNGWWEVWNGNNMTNAVNIPKTESFIKFTVNLDSLTCYIGDIPIAYNLTHDYKDLSTELCLYKRSDNWSTGWIEGRVQKIVVYGGRNVDRIDFELYPVYRKSDNKPGMYDIVNNVFYVNQGTGEFVVGPDTEWEE